ncbi:MAG TPA: bile acid:sodium symporter family protein [Draconibacterium sp.]|nr:bile acid:sodium symporter family protein [Draconibacterium sp.]
MKKINFNKLLLGISGVFLIITLIMAILGDVAEAGPFVILFFITLAFGVKAFDATKGLSYTVWIFTGVSAAMYYPQYFVSVGNFKFSVLIVPLLQLIMFGMGSQMSFKDFVGIIKMPKGVIIGIFAQFTIMPLVAVTIASIFDFPPEIAAGIILIGCVPSGLASNVMSFLARANVPLAVTLAAITTLLSPLITPLLMKWLAGTFIEVNSWGMMLDMLNMIILPIVAGFIFNLFINLKTTSKKSRITQLAIFPIVMILTGLVYMKAEGAGLSEFFVYVLKRMAIFYVLPIIGAYLFNYSLNGDKKIMDIILSYVSMVGIAFIVIVITAAGRESLLVVGVALIFTSLLHNFTGYGLGYFLAWIFKMPEKDRRTIAFEVGMQNGGLASGLALEMGKIATVGLAPAVFGPLMNITGSVLANFWRSKSSKDIAVMELEKDKE